ncbi:MAG: hypothetical protein KDI33_02085 [Halioglobus sp.]|nr:hypothetical protein [Halioglobus sp.]
MPEKKVRRGRKRGLTKDRVLQARIPEQLDDELRGRAEQLGLSVSTIVRNVLLNTFDLVEGVVSDSSQIARALSGRQVTDPANSGALPAPTTDNKESLDAVIGWQQVVLNKNGLCETCNDILPIGGDAAIGVPTGPRPILLCLGCLAQLSTPSAAPAATTAKTSKPAGKTKIAPVKAGAGRRKPAR